MAAVATSPPVAQTAYPERLDKGQTWLDRAADRIVPRFVRLAKMKGLAGRKFVRAVNSFSTWAAGLSTDEIRGESLQLGMQLRNQGFTDSLSARCFSLIREAAGRTIGQRHFDVQLIGGRILLHGMIAEMDTGEGKTLTATLAAATAALAGVPVHVITVNDYLANRDAESMGPVYRLLGLTVGTVVHGLDVEARRAAYRCDVAYCTNKELVFDYLKDRIVLGGQTDRTRLQAERLYERRPRLDRLLLRGLFFGIVDEADSVLVDEARTPLIISGANRSDSSEQDICETALSLAAQMILGQDFLVESRDRAVKLLPSGMDYLASVAGTLGGVWTRRQWREETVGRALAAHHLYNEGKQYLIKDGTIQIIDEYTGRVMPDRSWEQGLHQMIEAKEGCSISRRTDPLARISYQRFFRRYLRLSGMTGTASEVSGEVWSVYRLPVARVPSNRPCKRQYWQEVVLGTQEEKWDAVVARVAALYESGRPVLIGTRSVEASERLSSLLAQRGLEHQLLNARQDLGEATIIAQAGRTRRITVATNMAGRGTDIKLEPRVVDLGGLHVIATELHDARRIDRQLFGRCGRQGDPGSCEAILSLDDDLPEVFSSRMWKSFDAAVGRHSRSSRLRLMRLKAAQRRAERLHRRMRRDLLKMDEHRQSTLAFSGKSE